MQRISPFLWFDHQAEEAANFYVSIFKDSKITKISRYGEEGAGPAGGVMVVNFQLEGQDFIALNGGPDHPFNLAVSFMIYCDNQEEVDYYWAKLSEGGKEIQCGWLNDKYGLPWQVVPKVLMEMIGDPDKEKASRALKAMMGMVKLDIPELKRAYDGK